jgi:hypothetical protein
MKLEDICKYLERLEESTDDSLVQIEICSDYSGCVRLSNDRILNRFGDLKELETLIQEQTDAGSEPKDEAGTETCEICGCENREHYSTCTIGFPESSLGWTGE